MNLSEKELATLGKAKKFEDQMDEDNYTLGWRWYEVGAYTATITKLIVAGLVRISFKSNSETRYQLTDEGKAAVEGKLTEEGDNIIYLPAPEFDADTMFSDIIGYDNIKTLLRESLQLDKPIHVLLIGPPALAKSMFLWDIERAFGDQAMPLLGSATSHAGLWDLLADRRPKVVLVDELEKMSLTDMAGLLSLMQTGRIIRAKVGRKLDVHVNAWVIGAVNRTNKMPVELLSRFAKCTLTEYSSREFREVVTNVLISQEDTSKEAAQEISIRLVGKTHDVRDAIRVARLAKRVGVEKAVELLLS